MNIRFIKKADIVIVAVLLLIAAVLLLPRIIHKDEKLTAQIIRDGKVIETVDLSEVGSDYTIDLGDAKILVRNNAISFADADCPDKLCVRCGLLKRSGDTAVCVPTRTVITVTGQSSEVDVISY